MNAGKKINKKRDPIVIDLNLPIHSPTKGPNLKKEEPWRVKQLKAEKEKLTRDAIKVLRFLEQIVTKTPGDPIPIRRRQIIDAIKEDADKSETELQRRADLAMRNFGFEKGLDAESRDVSYTVPKKDVEDLCESYADVHVAGAGVNGKGISASGLFNNLSRLLKFFTAKIPDGSGAERPEKYWYPAFKLKDNPFRHFEASLEEDVETAGPYIETDMERRIGALLNAKVSAIVKGPRGCGKSTLVSFGAGSKGANFIRVATPKNITDLYDKIFLGFKPTVRDESAKEIWGDNLEKLIDYGHTRGTVGQESVCTLCRRRCPLPTPVYSSLETILAIFHIQPPCLARKTIAEYAVGFSPPDGCLLDIPDDADQGDIINLTEICVSMIQYSTLIIFATDEQAKMLAGSDAFSRLRVIEFEMPAGEFLIKLFKGRIDASRGNGGAYPFEDGVIEKIASLANYNAREFIHICSLVLVEMWMRKMAEPCTLKFLSELKLKPAVTGDRSVIIGVLKRHDGKWAGISELAREFGEAVGAPYTGRKAGAMVRDFGFDQFKHDANGRSQVLISPNVLNAIVRAEDTEHSEDTEG